MAKHFTQLGIEKIKPSEKRKEIADAALSGLYLIVQPSGTKTFAYRYRYQGKPRKLTLGRFPKVSLSEARDRAIGAFKVLEKGSDPKEATHTSTLFQDVFSEFLKRHVSQNRTAHEIERQFKTELLPVFRERQINEISRREISLFLNSICDRGAPIMSNRLLATLKTFFSWANSTALADTNPCIGLRPPTKETARERVLNEYEIGLFWKISSKMHPAYSNYFKFLLLSGQRRTEVSDMTFNEIEGNNWIISGARTKNGKEHIVPITDLMKTIIEDLKSNSHYLFSVSGKHPINNRGRATTQLRNLMNVSSEVSIPHWTPHDLRRTAASEMAREGVFVEVIEKLQNRSTGKLSGVAGIYNRYDYADEKREALELWSQTVERCISK